MVGKPWTVPLIWLWTYSLGHWLLGGGQDLTLQPEDFSFEHIFENPPGVLLPLIVGSIPSAVVVWLVISLALLRMVARYQNARRGRLRKTLHRGVAALTHPAGASRGGAAIGSASRRGSACWDVMFRGVRV